MNPIQGDMTTRLSTKNSSTRLKPDARFKNTKRRPSEGKMNAYLSNNKIHLSKNICFTNFMDGYLLFTLQIVNKLYYCTCTLNVHIRISIYLLILNFYSLLILHKKLFYVIEVKLWPADGETL